MCELRAYERRVYSQFGEDGIIEEMLRRLGPDAAGRCVEVGSSGEIGNCYLLAERGRPTLFVDADREAVCRLMGRFAGPRVAFVCARVTAENVNEIVPADTAMLSIDIDGVDYWVWRAVQARPAVVVVEINWTHRPPARVSVPYDPEFVWDGSDYHGASLSAMAALGDEKGYMLVATDSSQANAYFVRRDVARGRFTEETPEALWGPAPWGSHPRSGRPWVEV